MRDSRRSAGFVVALLATLSFQLASASAASPLPLQPAPEEVPETPNPWLASRPASETAVTSAVQITKAPDGWRLRYRIARGDTMGKIAERLSVPMRELMAANHIRDARRIVAGHWLQVPS